MRQEIELTEEGVSWKMARRGPRLSRICPVGESDCIPNRFL